MHKYDAYIQSPWSARMLYFGALEIELFTTLCGFVTLTTNVYSCWFSTRSPTNEPFDFLDHLRNYGSFCTRKTWMTENYWYLKNKRGKLRVKLSVFFFWRASIYSMSCVRLLYKSEDFDDCSSIFLLALSIFSLINSELCVLVLWLKAIT